MAAIAAAAVGMRWPVLVFVWLALAAALLVDAAWRLSPRRTLVAVSLLGLVVGFCAPMISGVSSRYRSPFNSSMPNRALPRPRSSAAASGNIEGGSGGPVR